MTSYTEIAGEIAGNAAALSVAVETFTAEPAKSKFLTYGCLMACMGQIDLMSKCEFGKGEPPGGQTPRMLSFMERYLDAAKADVHRVVVQLMRHTLMHTSELRFLYDETAETGYTWRIHFADTFPAAEYAHYTLTTEDTNYQDTLIGLVSGTVTTVKALNLNITRFADDIRRVAEAYTTDLLANPTLQTNSEAAYPGIQVQPFKAT